MTVVCSGCGKATVGIAISVAVKFGAGEATEEIYCGTGAVTDYFPLELSAVVSDEVGSLVKLPFDVVVTKRLKSSMNSMGNVMLVTSDSLAGVSPVDCCSHLAETVASCERSVATWVSGYCLADSFGMLACVSVPVV